MHDDFAGHIRRRQQPTARAIRADESGILVLAELNGADLLELARRRIDAKTGQRARRAQRCEKELFLRVHAERARGAVHGDRIHGAELAIPWIESIDLDLLLRGH